MKRLFSGLVMAMLCTAVAEAGVVISIANQTVNVNSTFSVDVFASATGTTTGANYFNLELQVVSASTATPGVTGQIAYTTPAGVPTFSNTNYLFYGDSFAETTWNSGAGSSSWSVSQLGWADDTYNFTDASNSGTDLSLTTPRYLATLYFTVGATASGDYQIVLGSSEFDVDASNAPGELPEFPVMDTGTNSGLITVNGGGGGGGGGSSSVPEPGTAVFGGVLLTGVALWRRRCVSFKA